MIRIMSSLKGKASGIVLAAVEQFLHKWADNFLAVDFSDTGGGMTEEQIRRIFEPFYSTKVIGHGTGLGVSIAKKIMEDHGVSIGVRSVQGEGSRDAPDSKAKSN